MNVEKFREQHRARPFEIVRWWDGQVFGDWAGQLHENDVPGLDGCKVRFAYITDKPETDWERAAVALLREWFAQLGTISIEIERLEVAAGTVPPEDLPDDAHRATRRIWEQLLRRGEP